MVATGVSILHLSAMRITNQHIERSNISRLQANAQALDRAREQVSSGQKISIMSDDPGAASEIVRTSSSLRAITQYKRNVSTARERSSAEESVLDQLTNTIDRAVEVAVQGASSTSSAATRTTSKSEIDQALSFAVALGNTKIGDHYLFGGTRGSEQPLKSPATPTGPLSNLLDAALSPVNPSGGIPLEIRDGYSVTPNHNATQVFIDSNALQALRDLSAALGNNDVPGINAALGLLQNAGENVQSLLADQGARSNAYQVTADSLDTQELDITKYRSDLRDVDAEKALVELSQRQTGYQAALTATSKVLGLSLANYL